MIIKGVLAVVSALALSACVTTSPCDPCLGEDGGAPKSDGGLQSGDGGAPSGDGGGGDGCTGWSVTQLTPGACKGFALCTNPDHRYDFDCDAGGNCTCSVDDAVIASVVVVDVCSIDTCYIATACGGAFPGQQCE